MDTVLGIDIGGTSITCGLVKGKELISVLSKPTLADKSAEEVFENLASCIDALINNQVKAIGLGVPGLLNQEEGCILNISNIPAWKDFPLRNKLQEKYNIPVFLDNDANCFALGTKHFGKGYNYKNFAGIVLGTGVGGGLIIDDKIHSGLFCSAGEIGCMPYKDGTFETYCASTFFPNNYKLSGKEMADKANAGDADAIAAFHAFGYHLGKLATNIIFTLSPEAIILGGSISQSFHLFKSGLDAAMEEFPFKSISSNIDIIPDHFDNIAVLGAAGLYYNSL